MLGFKPNPWTTRALNIHSYDYSYLKGNKSIKKKKPSFYNLYMHAHALPHIKNLASGGLSLRMDDSFLESLDG